MGLEGKRVLYISYNGMLDPLGQSQVIPYLRALSRRGVGFELLSFERAEAWTAKRASEVTALGESLARDRINWHRLKYHSRPSLPATAYDVLAGIKKAREIAARRPIDLIHARSHIPATIALAVKRRLGARFVFDLRGLMAEEYVDAEHWREGSLPFRLTKNVEARAFAAADGMVTLTERIWPLIREWKGLQGRTLAHEVVPCCADLQKFRFDASARHAIRRELGIGERFVIVYSGSIGGWYQTEAMADFFAVLLRDRSDTHALWLTISGHEKIRSMMNARGIGADRFSIVASPPAKVASYLSAADAGLAFIKPCFSKLASSPTKNAEYLACGLPLVLNADIGDSDALITQEKLGVLVKRFSEDDYRAAITDLRAGFGPSEETRLHCRAVAERLFDVCGVGIERYNRLYDSVLGGPLAELLPSQGGGAVSQRVSTGARGPIIR